MIPVTFLGYQERLDETRFLLVNEVNNHNAVTYDKKKYYLVPKIPKKENKNANPKKR